MLCLCVLFVVLLLLFSLCIIWEGGVVAFVVVEVCGGLISFMGLMFGVVVRVVVSCRCFCCDVVCVLLC